MVSSDIAAVRDLLYLSSMFLGFSLGIAVPLLFLRQRYTRVSLARRRVVSALLFAISVGFATVSFVISGGSVIRDTTLLIAAVPCLCLALAGAAFPRIVGFPLFVAFSSAVVLFAWAFLVFPEARDGALLGRVRLNASGEARVWFDADPAPDIETSVPDSSDLRFTVLRIDFDRRLPLVGASTRVYLREVSAVSSSLGRRYRRSLVELLGTATDANYLVVPGVFSKTLTFAMPGPALADGARRDIVWAKEHPHFIE